MGTRRNIFIIGPMGAGKTTVGKRLAELRGMEFVDSDHEIEARLAQFTPPAPQYTRGYGRLFLEHVTQANLGCDFDFLMK